MNNGSTSFQNPVKEKGEDLTGVLVIAVAVLGTLVSVGLLAGGVWACVVCSKISYRQRKWLKRQKFGTEGFPPQPREMVELGHIPHLAHPPDRVPYSVNNTGISRSFGICTSQSGEQLPSLPAPKSWTPSPPFDYKQNQAPMDKAQHYSHILHKKKQIKQARNLDIHSVRKKNNPNKMKGSSSIYHPGYNTLASDKWSVQPALSTSSSSHTLCPTRHSHQEVDQHTYMNTWSGKRYQTRWRESKMYDKPVKPPGKFSRHRKKVHAYVDSHKSNEYDYHCKNNSDEDSDPPDACSSYRGSPQASHRMAPPSPHQDQAGPSRAKASYHLASRTTLAGSTLTDGARRSRPTNSCTHGQNMIQRKSKDEKQEKSQKYRGTYSDPIQSQTCTKSRRLWRESCGFRDEVEPSQHTSGRVSGPCWMHHSQTHWRQPRGTDPLPSPSQHSMAPDTHEREVFRRVAQKYGFCEICGYEKSLDQQHEAVCGDDRNVVGFSEWDERYGSSPNEPTPSMSWDNLTPEPSPAVADIHPSQGTARANSTHTNEKEDHESNGGGGGGGGCDSFIPARENTYTLSCQSGGEG